MEQGDGYTEDVETLRALARAHRSCAENDCVAGCGARAETLDRSAASLELTQRQAACIEDLIALLGWQREADAILEKHGLR